MIYIYDESLERAFVRASRMTGRHVDSANRRTNKQGKHIGYKVGLIRDDDSAKIQTASKRTFNMGDDK